MTELLFLRADTPLHLPPGLSQICKVIVDGILPT